MLFLKRLLDRLRGKTFVCSTCKERTEDIPSIMTVISPDNSRRYDLKLCQKCSDFMELIKRDHFGHR